MYVNKINDFINTLSLTCVLINIGLFIFAELYSIPYLQLLALFNIATFLFYYLIEGHRI